MLLREQARGGRGTGLFGSSGWVSGPDNETKQMNEINETNQTNQRDVPEFYAA
jgi:hypothetical protein